MIISVPSLHRAVPVKLCSCEVVRGEAQPQVPVHVRALVLLGLHGVKELLELRHVGLGHLRLHPAVRQIRVADHVARVARDHEAAGFLWFVVRDSCVERLCTSASSLIMMSSHWCVPPSRSRKTRALWLPSSRSLDTCSLLQPAQFFVRKRSSEKSEVLVTVSVLEAKSCGAETVPELVASPHTTLPVETPPLVAVKVQSTQKKRTFRSSPFLALFAPKTEW